MYKLFTAQFVMRKFGAGVNDLLALVVRVIFDSSPISFLVTFMTHKELFIY